MFSHVLLSFAFLACSIRSGTAASVDIGSPNPAGGSLEISPGNWNVNGSGADIWGQSDSFHFLHFQRLTDFTLTTFVETWDTVQEWSKGGLMVRESLAANSAYALICSTGSSKLQMQYRKTTGGTSGALLEAIGTKRVWLRLVKEGSKMRSFFKKEFDTNWKKLYEESISFTSSSFYVGIAVTSHYQTKLAALKTSSFEISDEVFVPVPPRSLDIGGAYPVGKSIEVTPSIWTVSAAGYDIWGSSDSFHFVQFSRSSDVTVTAFVESWDAAYSWAKGGLMIRDTLDADSVHAMICSTGESRVAMQYRTSTSGSSEGRDTGIIGTKRVWLRLVKEGSKITSYWKGENEIMYRKIGSVDAKFSRSFFYAGIAATSHTQGTLATLNVSNFEIVDEVFTLPAMDIGDTGRAIDAQKLNDENWFIKGAGWDIGGTADSFGFNNYKQTGTNITATVHLGRLESSDINSKGGIMIRASHSPDAPHVSLLTTKSGITMYYRKTAGGGTDSENVGVWSENMELKIEKSGNSIACLYKHRSFADWFYLDSVAIDLGSAFYVGHAVTSARYGEQATLYAGNIYVDGELVV